MNAQSTQERDRSKIPDKYKWNLSDLYPSDAAWKEAKQKLVDLLPSVEKYQGTLAASAQNLLECLDLLMNLNKEYARLSLYAIMIFDQDMRVQTYQAMVQELSQIGSIFRIRSAFIKPEILKIDPARIQEFFDTEKKLNIYRHYIDDSLRCKAHTGTEGEEKIIADASLMSGGPGRVYNILTNADFPYPEVTLSDGKTVKLDKSGYSLYRAVHNRADREKVFSTFFTKLNDFRRTFGAELDAAVRRDLFYMNARKYASSLERSFDIYNISTQVYRNLIENVNKHLSSFHRSLKLRRCILDVDQLHYYDLYAPLSKGFDLKYTIDEAQMNILSALEPLGSECQSIVKKAFNDRWIDVFPTEKKQSGGYSHGAAYDVHPYILINYTGMYHDLSTLAHELGHTMHSFLSNKNQPYVNSQYPSFVAEVASTFNEMLLNQYMLKNATDNQTRIALLDSYLENIKGTLFRQTQFAEFELRVHEMAERSEPLTGDVLNSVYDEIVKKYYGHQQGVCIVDDEIKAEWIPVSHFYSTFYVYQYATSFTASTALTEHVLSGNKAATKKYISFLSAGGSEYPIDLLKKAGVDMTTSESFDLTMDKMNRVMDEMEEILDSI